MKNKILTISIIFILLSFIFINNCFAFTFTRLDGVEYWIPNLPEEPVCYVYARDKNWHSLSVSYVKGSYFKIHESSTDDEIIFACYDSSGKQINFTRYGCSDGQTTWQVTETKTIASFPPYCYDSGLVSGTLYNINGTIFFRQPPVTLAETLEKSNPTKSFQTMMSGIIPYLIALVVGLVAFWKAWSILSNTLRKA